MWQMVRSWLASRALRVVPVEARVETMCAPGAVRVGWNWALPGSPREEKSVSSPSGQCVVSCGKHPAAAAMTQGASANGFMVSGSGPSLPAAKTTVMPLSWAFLLALLIGSLGSQAWEPPLVPQELLTTLRLYCLA